MDEYDKLFLYFTIGLLLLVIVFWSILYFIFGDIDTLYQPMWRLIGNKLYYF